MDRLSRWGRREGKPRFPAHPAMAVALLTAALLLPLQSSCTRSDPAGGGSTVPSTSAPAPALASPVAAGVPSPLGATPTPAPVVGARSYLPRVGMKYHYRRSGIEGREEEFFLTVGRGSEGTLLTTLEWTPSEDNYVTHFVAGTGGVYMVADSAPQSRALWLPSDPRPGTAWVADGNPCRVMKAGTSLEHGGHSYRDCLLVEREVRFEGVAPPVGGLLHQFYAPGVGLVLSRDVKTGRVLERLLEVTPVGEQEAATEVRQQSVSLDKIR